MFETAANLSGLTMVMSRGWFVVWEAKVHQLKSGCKFKLAPASERNSYRFGLALLSPASTRAAMKHIAVFMFISSTSRRLRHHRRPCL
jgi:hypothetical protein